MRGSEAPKPKRFRDAKSCFKSEVILKAAAADGLKATNCEWASIVQRVVDRRGLCLSKLNGKDES